jgi:hypothetical protein
MVRIVECGRTLAGDYVAFDIQWEGDLDTPGSVLWAMSVSSDGGETVRLGYQRSGDDATQFVDDDVSGRRSEVDPDADVGDGEITVRFPAPAVGVAVEWPLWRALLVVDGEQVADCIANAG